MADFEVELTRESSIRFRKDLTEYGEKSKEALIVSLRNISLRILTSSIKNLQEHGNIASGKLVKDGKFKISEDGMFADVYYTGYAGSIEFGRKAGKMPPVDIIQQWVKRKLRIDNIKKAKSAAFAIAKSIAKNGTRAYPFLGPAYDEHAHRLRSKVLYELNKLNK